MSECCIDGCSKPVKSRCNGKRGGPVYRGGLCSSHYEKLRRHGDPLHVVVKRKRPKTRRDPNKRYHKGDGYYNLYRPDHPMSNKIGYILEHRYVMSEHLGRLLESHEHVHHKDGDRGNNSIENLELWTGNHLKGVRHRDKVEQAIKFLKKNGYKVERTCE